MNKHEFGSIKRTQRIRTSVKALIVHQDKVLMIKEKVLRGGEEKIIYDVPGGGIEFGEKLEEALRREVLEEVGLRIEVGRVVGAWQFIITPVSDPLGKMQIINIGYQCYIKGSAKIDLANNPAQYENIFAYHWYTKEEILSQPEKIPLTNQLRQAVERLE